MSVSDNPFTQLKMCISRYGKIDNPAIRQATLNLIDKLHFHLDVLDYDPSDDVVQATEDLIEAFEERDNAMDTSIQRVSELDIDEDEDNEDEDNEDEWVEHYT